MGDQLALYPGPFLHPGPFVALAPGYYGTIETDI